MDSIPQTSGVYKIVCVPTGKVYVGSATHLRSRFGEHRNALRKGKHSNRYLQHAWNKYGESAFEFVVIELVLLTFVTAREQYWMNKLRAVDHRRGFNLAPQAGSNAGTVRSEETRRQISQTLTGRKNGPTSPETRARISAAKRGKKYKPHSEAASIAKSERMRGREVSPETRAKIGAANRGRPPSEATMRAHLERICKTWAVTDPNGNEQIIKGLNRFCREHGLTTQAMHSVANGKQRHHKGWKCRRVD